MAEEAKSKAEGTEIVLVEDSTSSSSDPDLLDPSIPHPLQFTWTFWYALPSTETTKRGWQKRHTKLRDVKTVQEFWQVFNNFVAPSKLADGGDLHFFRAPVEPEWEDHYNAQGGAFQLFLPVADNNGEHADYVWLKLLLHMIGDHFDDADEICGLILSRRSRRYRFALWIKTASDQDARKRIALQMRQWSMLDTQNKIQFRAHEDVKNNKKNTMKTY
jgi:translation initiation factor 4E